MGNQHSTVSAAATPGERAHRQVVLRLRVLNERSEWEQKKMKDGRAYDETPVRWTNHKALRFTRDIDCDHRNVEKIITSFDEMPLFDPDCDHVELVRPSIYPEVDALRIACKKTNIMAAARDFGVLWSVSTQEDGYTLVSSYVDAGPIVPDHSGYVRATCHAYGFLVQKIPEQPNHCRVSIIMCFDVNGWVPQKVIDFAAPQLAKILDNIRERALQAGSTDMDPSIKHAPVMDNEARQRLGLSG